MIYEWYKQDDILTSDWSQCEESEIWNEMQFLQPKSFWEQESGFQAFEGCINKLMKLLVEAPNEVIRSSIISICTNKPTKVLVTIGC